MSKEIEQSFSEGMVQDLADQPENTFIDAFAFQLISNTNNTFAVETSKGNVVSFSLTKNYRPIAGCVTVDRIIIFSAYAGIISQHNGEIGSVTIDLLTANNQGTYIPVYNHQGLNFRIDHQIEGYCFPENNNIERVYYSDFNNPPRSINYFQKVFSLAGGNYYVTGALIIGTQYMVLTNSIMHNGTSYGPNDAAGTVFTAINANYVGLARVILYVPVESMDWVPRFLLSRIHFQKWINGSLLSGGYQYFYQLINTDGAVTPWSMPTRPVLVAGPANPGGNSASYQKYQGHSSSSVTQMGVRLLIDSIDPAYVKIRVAAIRLTALNVADVPGLIFSGPITGTSMTIDHSISQFLEPLLIDDLKKVNVNLKKVKTLSATNNIAFAANLETAPDFDFTPSKTLQIKHIYRDMLSDTTTALTTNSSTTVGLTGHDSAPSNVVSGAIHSKQWYKVFASGTVTYNGVTYTVGQSFQGISGIKIFTRTGGAIVKAIIRLQRYTGTYDEIPYEGDWYDHKGVTASNYLMSAWRSETYRIGILLYDTVGNPLFVRWGKDKTVPEMFRDNSYIDPDTGNAIGFDMRLGYQYGTMNGTGDYLLRSIGFSIDQLNLKEITDFFGVSLAQLPNYISGFSIVIAPRDAQVMGQGLQFACAESAIAPLPAPYIPKITPCGPKLISYDKGFNDGTRKTNVYMIYSPDFNFANVINSANGDLLQIIDYLEDQVSGIVDGYFETGNYHLLSKHYNSIVPPQPSPVKGRKVEVNNIETKMVEFGATTSIHAELFINATETTGFYIYGDRFSTMARGLIAVTKDTEGGGDLTQGFGEYNQYAGSKPLVNYIRPKSVLYGGNSVIAQANTQYISTGHFQPLDAAFMAYLIGNAGIVNDVEVFGGDCFLSLFDIGRGVKDNSSADPQISWGSIFPVESNSNPNLREGRHLARDRSYEVSEGNTIGLSFASPTQPENWIYNQAYSNRDGGRTYLALPADFFPTNKFPYMSRFTGIKTPGELIDTFKQFAPNDFRNVSGRFGSITNLREKRNRIYYWQQRAVGYIPVQERTQMSTAIGDPLTVGQGGIATRYDERTSFFGNQHQWSLCEIEDGFMWYDMEKNCPVIMLTGGELDDLAPVKGMISFFQNDIKGIIKINDTPVAGIGITSVYDPRFKRVLMTFKGMRTDGRDREDTVTLAEDFTIIYNVLHKHFEGRQPYAPGLMVAFKDFVFSSPHNPVTSIVASKTYLAGDTVAQNTDEYVALINFTTANPAILPSLDPTHWALSHNKHQIFCHNLGDLGKWYGKVYPSTIRFRILGEPTLEKIFDNWRYRMGNANFFDNITVETTRGQGKDSNVVKSGNLEYERRNEGWQATIPLNTLTSEQMQGYYLEVLLEKDNRLNGSPITSSNEMITLVTVKTVYRKAY